MPVASASTLGGIKVGSGLSIDSSTGVLSATGGGGGSSLPEVTAADNGKVLTVVNGAWDVDDVPEEVPAVSSADAGKILRVASGGSWAAVTPHYIKYTVLESMTEYNSMSPHDFATVYFIGDPIVKIYIGSILLWQEI